jgi:hypothetical protein
MEILFAVALMAGLFLPIELLRFPSSRLSWVPDRVSHVELVGDTRQPGAAEDGPGEPAEMSVQMGLFTSTHIQRRLHALAEELERLDRDREIFAKAFHTTVARSAYEALMVDASKLSEQPSLHIGQTLLVEHVGPSIGHWEELEL